MSKFDALDQRILDMIDIVRATNGSCTAGQVANKLKMSKSSVVARCASLREQGLVTWTPSAGSLRRILDPRQRIYELEILAEITRTAAQSETDLTHDELVERGYALNVIADARRSAGLDEAVPPAPVGVVPGGDPSQQPPTEAAAATPGAGPDELRCDTCDRTFKNLFGLNGHLKSRAHLARVQAA